MRRFFVLLLAAVMILGGCVNNPVPAPGPSTPGDDPMPPAPLFELEDLNGATWSLEALKGEVVVLYFWTGSCPTCLDKLPQLYELQAELPEDVNLLLLNGGDSEARVRDLISDYPNLTVLMKANPIFAAYGVRYVPTTIFIDREGNFNGGYVGPIPNEGILEIIEELR